MLRDAIEKYIDWPLTAEEIKNTVIKYNCAEAILSAANDYYGLGLDDKTIKAIAPFGGGFYLEKTCGFVSGGLAAIGVMFATDEIPYANPKVIEMAQKWVKAFEERFGDTECKVLKDQWFCRELGFEVADLFESVVGSQYSSK